MIVQNVQIDRIEHAVHTPAPLHKAAFAREKNFDIL